MLNDKGSKECYEEIESIRSLLLKNKTKIHVNDFGAGSAVIKTRNRVVADIASSSLKPVKYAQLLHRIAAYYHHNNIVELGTSFGVTAAYLAKSGAEMLNTFEGSEAIAEMARDNFKLLDLQNIRVIEGNIDDTLTDFLCTSAKIDMAFIDGNHRKVPTLRYFQELKPSCHKYSVLIFDDIHWSKEMEAAWTEIKNDSAVTLSIDLFFIGLVFFRNEFKIKQHFTIRF